MNCLSTMRLQAGASAGIIQSRASVQSERVVATSARPSRPFRTALAVVYTSMLLSMQPAIGSAEPLLESQWTPSAFTGMTQQQSKADTADEVRKGARPQQIGRRKHGCTSATDAQSGSPWASWRGLRFQRSFACHMTERQVPEAGAGAEGGARTAEEGAGVAADAKRGSRSGECAAAAVVRAGSL